MLWSPQKRYRNVFAFIHNLYKYNNIIMLYRLLILFLVGVVKKPFPWKERGEVDPILWTAGQQD